MTNTKDTPTKEVKLHVNDFTNIRVFLEATLVRNAYLKAEIPIVEKLIKKLKTLEDRFNNK